MLSIDEVIAKHRKIAKTQKALYDACTLKERNKHFLREAEEHEQLAEWLEELKMLRELKAEHRKIGNIEGFNKGYNKAIDDFVKFANTMPTVEVDGEIRPMWLEEIAEQLKAGGNS